MELPLLDVRAEVAAAVAEGRAVVALESTLIAHGLPWPHNLETAQEAEAAIRAEGVVPATVAVWKGRPTVGLLEAELEDLAHEGGVLKASSRDIAAAVALGRTAATTVAATMRLAHSAGIRFFATGGIGGAHRHSDGTGDVSADLFELTRTPVAVVCSGVKNILDIAKTLEILETHAVPVLAYGTEHFPAFLVRSSGLGAPARVDNPQQAAAFLRIHWQLSGKGVVIAQPVSGELALAQEEFDLALCTANEAARAKEIRGPALTPFLMSALAVATKGKTIKANHALVVANARLGAQLAHEWFAKSRKC